MFRPDEGTEGRRRGQSGCGRGKGGGIYTRRRGSAAACACRAQAPATRPLCPATGGGSVVGARTEGRAGNAARCEELRGRPRSESSELFCNVDCRCERICTCPRADARIHVGSRGRVALSSAPLVSARARTDCYQLASTDASCRRSLRCRVYMQAGWLRHAPLLVTACTCAANVWTHRGVGLETSLRAASTGEGP